MMLLGGEVWLAPATAYLLSVTRLTLPLSRHVLSIYYDAHHYYLSGSVWPRTYVIV